LYVLFEIKYLIASINLKETRLLLYFYRKRSPEKSYGERSPVLTRDKMRLNLDSDISRHSRYTPGALMSQFESLLIVYNNLIVENRF
jgi:hypothetical protein